MEKQEWEELQALFDGALALPAPLRDAYLRKKAGSDEVIQEVQRLLEAHERAASEWRTSPIHLPPELLEDAGELLAAGQAIGHHRIEAKIGAGGMGVIYRALDTRLQRQVALKFLPNHLHGNAMARERFMTEARAASRLDHPNICVIHDIGETDEGHLFIAMPFYRGETLAARLSRGRLPAREAVDIAIQICDGLASAHRHNIVHRDIKPANIMLTDDGLTKILDFGVAKVPNVNLTGMGVGVGTPAYMAPEQLNGEPVDARADVWALGVTFYEMLCGQAAFPAGAPPQVVEVVLDERYDPLNALPADIPLGYRAILGKALQRDREVRYPSIAEMLDDLMRTRAPHAAAAPTLRNPGGAHAGAESGGYTWDAGILDKLIELLRPRLGPITPKLVQRYARSSATLDNLIKCLKDALPDDATRQEFGNQVKALPTGAPNRSPTTGASGTQGLELSPARAARLEEMLIPELGPIAGIVIRRTSASARDWPDLCLQLSQYFDDPHDARLRLHDIAE